MTFFLLKLAAVWGVLGIPHTLALVEAFMV
jgi:hypothetical protein